MGIGKAMRFGVWCYVSNWPLEIRGDLSAPEASFLGVCLAAFPALRALFRHVLEQYEIPPAEQVMQHPKLALRRKAS